MNNKGILDTRHPFHLVDPSPWPLVASSGALAATVGGVMWFHSYSGGGFLCATGMLSFKSTFTYDISPPSTHNIKYS